MKLWLWDERSRGEEGAPKGRLSARRNSRPHNKLAEMGRCGLWLRLTTPSLSAL